MRIIAYFIFLFLLPILIPLTTLGQDTFNAGFVSGIWYSKTPFFAGDTIRIYAALQNNSGFDIKGTAQFLNNNKTLGEADFSAINGRLVEVWADWLVFEGEHEIKVKIIRAFRVRIGEEPEEIQLQSTETSGDKQFADIDTDQDGIGNKIDTDDDNDGVTDEQEITLGSDPLKSNIVPASASTDQPPQKEISSLQTLERISKPVQEASSQIAKTTERLTKETTIALEGKQQELREERTRLRNTDGQRAPTPNYIADFFISMALYILHRWWLLLPAILILLRLLWELISLFR